MRFQRVTPTTDSISHGAGVRGNCLRSTEEMIVPRTAVKWRCRRQRRRLMLFAKQPAFNAL